MSWVLLSTHTSRLTTEVLNSYKSFFKLVHTNVINGWLVVAFTIIYPRLVQREIKYTLDFYYVYCYKLLRKDMHAALRGKCRLVGSESW
jgi:hypothetical protein